ncbi:type II toxin-antitoxin system VapC family toxin [Thermococcus barophilus]|uniref:PIN domain-containing protein n=1 Tax=Thermococcus barophilus TaxID=55802 RepID=A0A0S1XEF3_THEBA|nr:type II toxin-antitoxin system VapC family toxin [Thermococcus barophilus]ALM76141.1 hypothetical protein TBCH5v1_2244 [Thermococcus barophilus]
MIVIDTSVFIDALFNFNEERNKKAKRFFRLVQDNSIQIFEPDIFKIELIGQLVRRLKHDEAIMLYELITENIEFIETLKLWEISFDIALKTGCRAIDSFYIGTANVRNALLISNDKFQVESARKFGVKAFYLIEEIKDVEKALGG